MLDRAHSLGMTVLIGYWMNKRDQGMDYDDPKACDEQERVLRERVREYRDHPAVLGWSVGNEVELGDTSPRVFRQIERLAAMVKREDPRHPVMTVVADMWPEKMALLLAHCPSLDLLGVNSYGGLPTLHERMRDWKRPYMVTEFSFGAPGQVAETAWKTAIEPDGTAKAKLLTENYRKHVLGQSGRVLGSYFFHWSRSDSATASWFSSFLKTGEKLPQVDALTTLWGGRRPANRCPAIVSVQLPAKAELKPGEEVSASVRASDPDGDPLTYSFEVLSDDPAKRFVGDFEKPMPAFASGGGSAIRLKAPSEPGPYRVLVVMRDGKGAATTASIPFRVMP